VLLIDNSAWARRRLPGARERLAAAMEAGEIAACLPFLLEAGYSARSGDDHSALLADLALLPRVEIDSRVEHLAIHAQGQLAAVGHHRLPPTDIVISACAHRTGYAVLHYDRDYDLIAAHTTLEFESDWVAPAGSLT
jgi:predicted nucleic acid-binding protein